MGGGEGYMTDQCFTTELSFTCRNVGDIKGMGENNAT